MCNALGESERGIGRRYLKYGPEVEGGGDESGKEDDESGDGGLVHLDRPALPPAVVGAEVKGQLPSRSHAPDLAPTTTPPSRTLNAYIISRTRPGTSGGKPREKRADTDEPDEEGAVGDLGGGEGGVLVGREAETGVVLDGGRRQAQEGHQAGQDGQRPLGRADLGRSLQAPEDHHRGRRHHQPGDDQVGESDVHDESVTWTYGQNGGGGTERRSGRGGGGSPLFLRWSSIMTAEIM